jgi:alkanesulfonate monooxygenase SsuD/methylene tetrahydromethanopterin reductase-like flavin-dependent oxidoreductase (luciferase family)
MRHWLFFLGNPRSEEVPPAITYGEIVSECVLADELGYHGAWVGEHHWIPNNAVVPNPLLLCAAVAQATRRLRLGPGCIVLPLHNPHRVAEDIAMLDAISGGRLDVVLCRGDHEFEYRSIGVDIQESHRLYQQGLDIVLGYLGAPTGRVQKALVPPLTQTPAPPLWMTCGSQPSIAAALDRRMRVVIAAGAGGPARVRALREAFEAECQVRGLDPTEQTFGLLTHATLAESSTEVDNAVALGAFLSRTVARMKEGRDSYLDEMDLATPFNRDDWLATHIVGDESRIREQVAFLSGLGVTDLFLQFVRGSLEAERIKDSMRAFATVLGVRETATA